MLRLFPKKKVLRLFAWTLFAACLGFIAWILYVILPPKPRCLIQDCADVPYCFLDKACVVFVDSVVDSKKGFTVRDLNDGSIRKGPWTRQVNSGKVIRNLNQTVDDALMPWATTHFVYGDGRLRGFRTFDGRAWDLPLPDFVAKVEHAQASPDGKLLVLFVRDSEEKTHCLILDAREGCLLGRFAYNAFDVSVQFTPEFVVALLLKGPKRKMVLWQRDKKVVHSEFVFGPNLESDALNGLRVNRRALVLQEARFDEGAVVLWDLPEMRLRTELGRFRGEAEFRFSPDGELLVVSPNDGNIARVWNVRSRKVIAELADFPKINGPAEWLIWFSPDNRFLAAFTNTGRDSQVTVYDPLKGSRLWTKNGVDVLFPSDRMRLTAPVAFTPSGDTLAVEGTSGLEFLDSRTGTKLDVTPERSRLCALSTSGRFLLSVAFVPTKLTLLETLKEWLPGWLFERLHSEGEMQCQLVDFESGFVRTDSIPVTGSEDPAVMVSDDGQPLILRKAGDGAHTSFLCCWDVPVKRRWEWIIGVPAALALPVLAWRWRRWRKAARLSSTPAA